METKGLKSSSIISWAPPSMRQQIRREERSVEHEIQVGLRMIGRADQTTYRITNQRGGGSITNDTVKTRAKNSKSKAEPALSIRGRRADRIILLLIQHNLGDGMIVKEVEKSKG